MPGPRDASSQSGTAAAEEARCAGSLNLLHRFPQGGTINEPVFMDVSHLSDFPQPPLTRCKRRQQDYQR